MAVYGKFRILIFSNAKQVFLNSSCLKSVFEKLRFRDGLLSVDGTPNRRNKAAFV